MHEINSGLVESQFFWLCCQIVSLCGQVTSEVVEGFIFQRPVSAQVSNMSNAMEIFQFGCLIHYDKEDFLCRPVSGKKTVIRVNCVHWFIIIIPQCIAARLRSRLHTLIFQCLGKLLCICQKRICIFFCACSFICIMYMVHRCTFPLFCRVF